MMLAQYAARAEHSRGRRHPEPVHAYRDLYQRDRDRVIHSRAFRRLEDKTQVFTDRFSDHFRNRLTHTIEVAQITRTVAAELALNVDLAETLALVHDIGHPPFGHAGEAALDAEMRRRGSYFDHNLHALRIVEHFEERYADFDGLNLTFEVREGIVKHSRDYDAGHYPELAEYLLDERPPLEAQLVDLADEIAYNTADLDDGVESGILSIDQIRAALPLVERLYERARNQNPRATPKRHFNEAVRGMVDRFAGDLIATTHRALVEARIGTVEDVRKHPSRVAAMSAEVEAERAHAKKFLYENLYYSAQLRRDKDESERVITEIFDMWMSRPASLPPAYQRRAEREPLARVVCDYIAGMTDSYILRAYRRHCGKEAFAWTDLHG